jgi:uncharacterized protein
MVGDAVLNDSFALTPDEIIHDWPACDIGKLSREDFQPLMDAGAELILLGTGPRPVFPPRELVFSLARRNIGLETMDTAAACRTFNILVADGRKVAAVLIIGDQECGDSPFSLGR